MRVRIKTKKKKIIDDEDLQGLLNNMLDENGVDTEIAYPRYIRLKDLINAYISVHAALITSPVKNYFADKLPAIQNECEKAREEINTLFSYELNQYAENNFVGISKEINAEFSRHYNAAKNSNVISASIITCKNLMSYKKWLLNYSKPNWRFIQNMAGVDWSPIKNIEINFVPIFRDTNISDSIKKYIFLILGLTLEYALKIEQELTTPDVDVEKLGSILLSCIDKSRKVPELSRCGKAFDLIGNSLNLFKSKFSEYHRDYLATKNRNIIWEHFILDLCTETESSPNLKMQLQRILSYFKKAAEKNATNQETKTLLKIMNKQSAQLAKANKESKTDNEELEETNDESENLDANNDTNQSDKNVLKHSTHNIPFDEV